MVYMSEQKKQIIEKGWQAIEKIRSCAEQNGLSDMPLESINQIIREYRAERKKQIWKVKGAESTVPFVISHFIWLPEFR